MKKLTLAFMAASSLLAVSAFADMGNQDWHRHEEVVCKARNLRGVEFEAVGFGERETQERALQHCSRAGSLRCFALGCHHRH